MEFVDVTLSAEGPEIVEAEGFVTITRMAGISPHFSP